MLDLCREARRVIAVACAAMFTAGCGRAHSDVAGGNVQGGRPSVGAGGARGLSPAHNGLECPGARRAPLSLITYPDEPCPSPANVSAMLPSLDLGHGASITPGGLPKCPEALGDPAAGFRFRFRIDDIAKPEDNNGKYVRMIGANLDASPICGHLMTLGAPSLVVNAKVGDELILSSRFTGLGGDRLATTRTVADKQGNLLLAHVQNQGGPSEMPKSSAVHIESLLESGRNSSSVKAWLRARTLQLTQTPGVRTRLSKSAVVGLRSFGALLLFCQVLVGCGRVKDGGAVGSSAQGGTGLNVKPGANGGAGASGREPSPANMGTACDGARRSEMSLAIHPSETCPGFKGFTAQTVQPSLSMGQGYHGALPQCAPESLDQYAGYRLRFRIDRIEEGGGSDSGGEFKIFGIYGANLDASPICGVGMILQTRGLVSHAKVGDELILAARRTPTHGEEALLTRAILDKNGRLLLGMVGGLEGAADSDILGGLVAGIEPTAICKELKIPGVQLTFGTLRVGDGGVGPGCLFDHQTAGCCQLWGHQYFVTVNGALLAVGPNNYRSGAFAIYDPSFLFF